jgi:predicted nuclease of predicted toxin-antitoxin system
MKFLIDMPLSPKTAEYLRSLGHDAIHAFEIGKAKASDEELVELAEKENRIVITMDLDFGTILAHTKKSSPGLIIFRISFATIETVISILIALIQRIKPDEFNNSIIIVDDMRVRVRKLPL